MPSNKARILSAADELLQEKGPAGLSVRAIAALAGLSTIGIYSHFKGKQGILDALCIEGYNAIYDAMASVMHLEDPGTAVLEGSRNYLRVAETHEAKYRLIFGETGADYEPGEEALEAQQRAFQCLVTLVARLLPETAGRGQQLRAAVRVWALVHGYVSIHHHAIRFMVSRESWNEQALSAMASMVERMVAEGAAKAV